MAKKKEEFWVVNLTKQKVSLLEGKLIVAAGWCEQLSPEEVQHPEIFAAKRKGWISLQGKPLDQPLFDGTPPIKSIAVNAADGIAAAMGGSLVPPRRGTPTMPPQPEPIGSKPLGDDSGVTVHALGKTAEELNAPAGAVKKPRGRKKKVVQQVTG